MLVVRFLLFSGILCLVLNSCDNKQKRKAKTDKHIVEQKLDSTAYFDSIYQAYKDSIEQYFDHLHEAGMFNGVILFAHKNHIITEKAYGNANFEGENEPLTMQHTFQLASATKPFTATAILQLVEQGKLSLQDSVHHYISPFPYKGITIKMLLTHQSGLSRYTHFCDNPDTVWMDKDSTITIENVLEIIDSIEPPMASTPGKRHYYSNTNYILLAYIIEKVSGMPYEDYLQTHIFNAADMFNARVYNRQNVEELCQPTKGYTAGLIPEIDIYLNGCVGDKGIYASARDLFYFHKHLNNKTLLSKSWQDSAYLARTSTGHNEQMYGYGWRLYPGDVDTVFHTGWWKGYKTYFIRIPKKNQVAIVLSNVAKNNFLNVRHIASLLP